MNYTEASSLAAFSQQELKELCRESGHILYSSAESLVNPERVYLMGLNPGGDPDRQSAETIARHLNKLPDKWQNDYVHGVWEGADPGESLLQKRVVGLLNDLKLNPDRVVASNLVFTRSRTAKQLASSLRFNDMTNRKLIDHCWPIHERIMDMVDPRMMLVFGNSGLSPYFHLQRKLGMNGEECKFPSGHGRWKCKTFVTSCNRFVVGLPHLSRYAIDKHPEVIVWIKKLLDEAMKNAGR